MFYGWYMVGASLLLNIYNYGIFTYGFSAFINPIADTFGWGYAQITLGRSFRNLESSVLDPFIGMLVDRWPARRLMLIGVIIMGLGTLLVSQATSLVIFYAGFLVVGLGSGLAVMMVPKATVARWFRKNIGKASGMMTMGMGIGGMLLPVLVKLIDTYGWQKALIFLAVVIWLLGIPLSFVFRTRPEDYGLVPDGKPQDDAGRPSISAGDDFSVGVVEALKMPAFWYIGIPRALQLGTQIAAVTHILPYFTSLGVERSTSSMVVLFVSWASLATRLPLGWLSDIFPKKYVAAICTFLTSAGLFLFSIIDGGSFGMMVLFAIVFGLGIGGMAPLRVALTREYFGTKRFATIFGLLEVISALATMAFPPVAGWVFDIRGVYDPIWLIFAGLAAIATVLFVIMPSSSRKPKPAMS